MKELIIELAEKWHSYYELKHVDSSNRADELINKKLKEVLVQTNEQLGLKSLVVGASSGEGNITRGPWFASFDSRVTDKATHGFYVVFLFSTDMNTITLELGLGATQFTRFYGQNKQALQEIRNAALRMQLHAMPYLNNIGDVDFVNRVNLGVSKITDKRGYSLQRGYEEGAVLHITYDINESLDEDHLIRDYDKFIRIYQSMVEDKATPDNDALLSISIQPEQLLSKATDVEFVDFVPRVASEMKSSPGGSSKSNKSKRSSNRTTKEIGDWGEAYILKREIEHLSLNGREDLAVKVVHEEAQNNRPGWDITSYDVDGSIKRIEVKSTVSNSMSSLNLTANELNASEEFGDSYFLYLLTGVNAKGAKKVEVLQNPFKLISSGVVQVKPSAYELKLYGSE